MGLDLLEFTMTVEEAFDFRFPDEDVGRIDSPRKVIDYLAAHLPAASEEVCLSQRAFYHFRASLAARTGIPRSAFRPDTPLYELIPATDRVAVWDGVRSDLGAAKARHWTRLDSRHWYSLSLVPRVRTLRQAVRHLTTFYPARAKRPGEGWTRSQIEQIVRRLVREDLGINTDHHDYSDDMTFADMGID